MPGENISPQVQGKSLSSNDNQSSTFARLKAALKYYGKFALPLFGASYTEDEKNGVKVVNKNGLQLLVTGLNFVAIVATFFMLPAALPYVLGATVAYTAARLSISAYVSYQKYSDIREEKNDPEKVQQDQAVENDRQKFYEALLSKVRNDALLNSVIILSSLAPVAAMFFAPAATASALTTGYAFVSAKVAIAGAKISAATKMFTTTQLAVAGVAATCVGVAATGAGIYAHRRSKATYEISSAPAQDPALAPALAQDNQAVAAEHGVEVQEKQYRVPALGNRPTVEELGDKATFAIKAKNAKNAQAEVQVARF